MCLVVDLRENEPTTAFVPLFCKKMRKRRNKLFLTIQKKGRDKRQRKRREQQQQHLRSNSPKIRRHTIGSVFITKVCQHFMTASQPARQLLPLHSPIIDVRFFVLAAAAAAVAQTHSLSLFSLNVQSNSLCSDRFWTVCRCHSPFTFWGTFLPFSHPMLL